MKVVLTFLCLIFLPLLGSQNLYANVQTKNNITCDNYLSKKCERNFSNKDQTIHLLDEINLYLEEDYKNTDDFKLENNKMFSVIKYNFLLNCNSFKASLYALNIFNILKVNSLLCGYSCPIYVFQRVLRI